jgi:hypothetical protein
MSDRSFVVPEAFKITGPFIRDVPSRCFRQATRTALRATSGLFPLAAAHSIS